jgi:hypothetical protein
MSQVSVRIGAEINWHGGAKMDAGTTSRGSVIRPTTLAMPSDLGKELEPVGQEILRIHESVLWSAQVQFEQMKLWRSVNLLLGIPGAVLAAIAGGTGLAARDATFVPGILALIAAGFGAALTTLNPSRRVAQSQSSANAFLEIQTEARQFLTLRLKGMDYDDALERLSDLTVRRDDINKTADPSSSYAYWRARRNIEMTGGQSYEVDSKGKS